MRWGNPDPVWGTQKTIETFALVPTKMSSGEWVWWEYYLELMEWRDKAKWITMQKRTRGYTSVRKQNND